MKRTFARLNYPLQTEAVRLFIPVKADVEVQRRTYASEADLLNKIVFGRSAKEWREQNPKKKGNQRDDATIEQLHVLANMENLNAFLIKQGFEEEEPIDKSIIVKESKWLRASHSGMFHVRIKNGEWVTKKTVLGIITDPFGSFERKVYAPFDCYIFCVNISPIVNRGDAIFHVSLEIEEQ